MPLRRNLFRILRAALPLAALLLAAPRPAPAAQARLVLHSQPGDFIGQGGDFDILYDTAAGANVSAQIRRFLPGGSPAELLFVLGGVTPPPNTFALLFFGTDALGIPIQPGTYPDAQRADFASPGHPGLDVSFQNRGCNTLTGSFTITEVTFAPDPSVPGGLQIATFEATFEQHCEGAAPALFGSFRFEAVPVPEPSTLTLVGAGALGGLLCGWRRKRAA